jgi:hypothetical protein
MLKKIKNKRLFLVILLIVISSFLAFFTLRDLEKETDVDSEKLVLVGVVVSANDDGSFEFKTEDKTYQINVEFDEDFEKNDLLYLTGFLNKDNGIQAQNWTKLTREEYRSYLGHEGAKRNNLEIEIVDFPENVKDPCESFKITLKLTNLTENTISFSELFSEDSEFSIYYTLNGVSKKAKTLSDFGSLEPDESKEVEFVSEKDFFKNQKAGENEIMFGWGQELEEITPSFAFQSSGILINLVDSDCKN